MRRLLKKLIRTLRFAIFLARVPSRVWVRRLLESGFTPGEVQFDRTTGSIYLKEFGVCLSRKTHFFFLKSVHWARKLRDKAAARVYNDNGDLIIDVGGLTAIVQTEEDVLILFEIFVRRIYDYSCEGSVVVWDIGMNVAFSGLFFAAKKNVLAVRCFEPFQQTYAQAQRNLRLNPELHEKIKTFKYGVGGSGRKLVVPYNYDWKGHASAQNVAKYTAALNHFSGAELEEIELRSAPELLEIIRSEFPCNDIVAKIDCEGSEYEIIEALFKTGKLMWLRAIMMEWHWSGPEELIKMLQQAGFTIFTLFEDDGLAGMIYAVRSNA